MVQHDKEDLFYVYPEFNKSDYDINIVYVVYSYLPISKTTKLKEVYRTDEISEYLTEAKSSLWFFDDSRLVMSYASSSRYSDFALLKSSVLLDMYINVQNARVLKDKLEALLFDLE